MKASLSVARLVQSKEHETLNLRVVGSSPTLGGAILFFLKVHLVLHYLCMLARSSLRAFQYHESTIRSSVARLAQSVEHETHNLMVVGLTTK